MREKFPALLGRELRQKPLIFLRHLARKSGVCRNGFNFPAKFPESREIVDGDEFASDCLHHHRHFLPLIYLDFLVVFVPPLSIPSESGTISFSFRSKTRSVRADDATFRRRAFRM